ncbi:MAG: DUF721 domain-containing protein [Candidatus Aureabacteria bacterium]|nr:DUF721 domain-containing protein [Candidatus Auribacterota bacterium]
MAGETMRIGDVLDTLLRKLGLDKKARDARIVQEWERIVGPTIARHSAPAGMRGKILIVNVDSSVWLAELSRFFKEKILAAVRAELGEERIQDIRFRIGELKES